MILSDYSKQISTNLTRRYKLFLNLQELVVISNHIYHKGLITNFVVNPNHSWYLKIRAFMHIWRIHALMDKHYLQSCNWVKMSYPHVLGHLVRHVVLTCSEPSDKMSRTSCSTCCICTSSICTSGLDLITLALVLQLSCQTVVKFLAPLSGIVFTKPY